LDDVTKLIEQEYQYQQKINACCYPPLLGGMMWMLSLGCS